MKRINTHWPQSLLDEARIKATEMGVSFAALVRMAVIEYLAKHRQK